MEAPKEYIEFYRLDVSSSTRVILVPAALLIAFGSLFACAAAARLPLPIGAVPRDMVGFFGAATVLVGLVLGFGGMARLLSQDGFVGVTPEGIHVRIQAREDFVPWADVDAIRSDEDGHRVELVLHDARSVPLPAVSAPKGTVLRDRIEQLRRKASMNMLSRPAP